MNQFGSDFCPQRNDNRVFSAIGMIGSGWQNNESDVVSERKVNPTSAETSCVTIMCFVLVML